MFCFYNPSLSLSLFSPNKLKESMYNVMGATKYKRIKISKHACISTFICGKGKTKVRSDQEELRHV